MQSCAGPVPVRNFSVRRPLTGLFAGLFSLVLAACGGPPAGQEPTGEAAEDAWRLAVGQDPVDQAVAYAYSLALNSRDAPAVVQTGETASAELAAELSSSEDDAAGDGTDDGASYDLVVSRSLALAETLDPDGFAELAEPDGTTAAASTSTEDLTTLIEEALDGAEVLTPSAGELYSTLVITTVTAEGEGIDLDGSSDAESFTDACHGQRLGVDEALPEIEHRLAERYDCEPEKLSVAAPEDLVDQLITAEIDAAVVSSSTPQIHDYALVSVEDARGAFPTEQYLPVAKTSVAEEIPDVAAEVSESLDQDALRLIQRLLDGPDGLSPEEAAEYWLVSEEIIAEPEDWG